MNAIIALYVAAVLFLLSSPVSAGPAPRSGNPNDEILSRLSSIEAKLDSIEDKLGCTLDQFLEDDSGACESPASTTATFCFAQGLGMELGLAYAVEMKAEIEIGAGWPSAFWGKITGKPEIPVVIPVGPVPLIPIPTEIAAEGAGAMGRATDICVEIPVFLNAEDRTRIDQITRDMNQLVVAGSAGSGVEQGKFQRRAGRVVAFADRKVPPLFSVFAAADGATTSSSQASVDDDFDRIDAAVDRFLDEGLSGDVRSGLDYFRDPIVTELLASLELPATARDRLGDPGQMLYALRNPSGTSCEDFGITAELRTRFDNVDRLCARISGLPEFDDLQAVAARVQMTADDVIDAIAELLGPLLSDSSSQETAEQAKIRFCDTTVGRRRAFDRLCGR